MAITMIIGKTGQGKTLYQTKLLSGIIKKSPRPVLSNLPMDFTFYRYWILEIIPVPKRIYDLCSRFAFMRAYSRHFDSNDIVVTYRQIETCYDYAIMSQWANAYTQEEYEKQVLSLIEHRLQEGVTNQYEAPFYDFNALRRYPLERDRLSNGFIWAIDELASYFSARDYKNTPPQFLQLLTQHRKMRIDLIGTTQRYTSIDIWFRELAHNVFLVRKSRWLPRLHTVNAIEFDEVSGTEQPREVYTRFFGTKRLYSFYDTDTLITGRQRTTLVHKVGGNVEDERRDVLVWFENLKNSRRKERSETEVPFSDNKGILTLEKATGQVPSDEGASVLDAEPERDIIPSTEKGFFENLKTALQSADDDRSRRIDNELLS